MKLMEFLEGVKEFFGRGKRDTRWSYDYFHEYLLALARSGEKFLLPQDQYPTRIALNPNWHGLLDQLREITRDAIERWVFVGFKEDRRTLYFPKVPVKGLPDRIPNEVVLEKIKEARNRGIIGLVGDIHSHPGVDISTEQSYNDYKRYPKIFADMKLPGFSVGDLSTLIQPENTLQMRGVVAGYFNLFAFRTRGTENTPIDALRELVAKPSTSGLAWDSNIRIAKHYNLVLYRGEAGKDLVRVFPPIHHTTATSPNRF